MTQRTKVIYVCIKALSPLYDVLVQVPLSTHARKARAAYLFPRARRFVTWTARVLLGSPDLFPDIDLDAAGLAERQEEATALWKLSAHLSILARLGMDTYLDVQAQAVQDAMSAVKRVRQDDHILFNRPPRRLERMLAMFRAELFAPNRRQPPGRPSRPRRR